MKNNYIKSVMLLMVVCMSLSSFAQRKTLTIPKSTIPQKKKALPVAGPIISSSNTAINEKSKLQIENVKGSFYVDLSKERRTAENISRDFNKWFKLDQSHTFQLISSKTDDLKMTHNNYQQYYKGFIVEGSMIMIHSKGGFAYAANGQIAEFSNLETKISISKEDAKNLAKQFTKVTKVINDYPVETVVCGVPSKKGFDFKFSYKVRIASNNPFIHANLYVDAKSGVVINTVSLIADADTPATANTLYSGTQTITTDFSGGIYTLKDNARKIETYDATLSSATQEPVLYSNSTTNWSSSPLLTSFTITNVSQNWWYSQFGDSSPDLYIKVKDASNNIIYNGRNNYVNNTLPSSSNPIVFPLYNLLSNQPYSVEIWDYDELGGDDFGGSYAISSTSGIWSVNGNNGTYIVLTTALNPAVDIHWGMEKTYDFYKNIFNRDSFDNAGATIKNYYNPPHMQNGSARNNAYAVPQIPVNQSFMLYGSGDGVSSNPFVSIDVQGHEFTHLVVNNNGLGGLQYQGESGALNESFADIFGTCVEFFAKPLTANWTLGEDFILPAGNYARSLSNPSLKNQPKKYNGDLWQSTTNLNDDAGGVHQNSGVQNFWFYLLSQGGSGLIDDTGNPYSVTGIGINSASAIAYRNLTTHLTPNATYMDAYFGSLLAAQEIFGNPSLEYSSVRQAWYAVGIGNDPINACSGVTNLTASSGAFSDGSGNALYDSNANCTWVIAPTGATQITLNFADFNTEAGYDFVNVYNGNDVNATNLIGTFSGNSLPASISTSIGVGAMCINFTSDTSNTANGWSANYTSTISTPACSGVTVLATPNGNFSDGSGTNNYTNNQQCVWYIAPPCATSVTLSFSQLNVENGYDYVLVFDSMDATTPIGTYTGDTLPASITSNTGIMLVVFVSDFTTIAQGFVANYTSTGSSYFSGITTLDTADYGTLTDGSGTNTYCNNSNCSWLIQPPQATSVTLKFTDFELEQASSDGNAIYDAVEVYDGTSASSALLGRFTGNNIPSSITSTGGNMFIRFYSDVENAYQGWSAYYTSTQNAYCNETSSILTAPSGTISDGSNTNKYANNSNCNWLIQPPSAASITLSFSSFDTELNYDGVIVYDGANNTAPILGQFTGSSISNAVTSTGGSMYVSFLSDEAVRANGWTASYNSTTLNVNQENRYDNLNLFPNPTTSKVYIDNVSYGFDSVKIYNYLGQEVAKTSFTSSVRNQEINMSMLASGVYFLKFSNREISKSVKVIKQ